MNISREPLFLVWALLSFAVLVSVVVFDVRIIVSPDRVLVQFVPDDGYYYLGLARNFVQYGSWTFDSGLSTTSGFHPLNAYLLAALYAGIQPSDAGFVRAALILCSILSLGAGLTVWVTAFRGRRAYLFMFLALTASTRFWAFDTVSATEWPLVVLLATQYGVLCYRYFDDTRFRSMAILFGICLAGTLARSDFGVLPFSFFVGALILARVRGRGEGLRPLLAGFLGAVVGLGVLFIHNFIITGRYLQSSVAMKAFWSSAVGADYREPAGLILNVLGINTMSNLIRVALVAAVTLFLLALYLRSGDRYDRSQRLRSLIARPREATMLLGAGIALVGYVVVVYPRTVDVQPWYTSNLIVPCAVLLVIGAGVVQELVGRYRNTVGLVLSLVVSALVARNVIAFQAPGPNKPLWSHQQAMYEAGIYLRDHAMDGRVGAWNAGVIGYYQGGTLVNLDGLVNDEVQPYVFRNALPEYLALRDIRYVADFETVLTEKDYRVRGGYDDPRFLERLRPVKMFRGGDVVWNELIIFDVAGGKEPPPTRP